MEGGVFTYLGVGECDTDCLSSAIPLLVVSGMRGCEGGLDRYAKMACRADKGS